MRLDDAKMLVREAVRVLPDDTADTWYDRLGKTGNDRDPDRFEAFRETGAGDLEICHDPQRDAVWVRVYRRIDHRGAYCPTGHDLVTVYVTQDGIMPYHRAR